ncbi:AAA family ATPase [Sphingobacterium thalpophilum]|uniref:Nuclease sbcCD subunit C n=1 Tax=Sphingobacterium thalpophilum TaxID=259 RepID=A0A4U9VW26_9SPHI|nr:SMC family ATPase [Sphingobacterium thalpophilum]VTR50279.1 Nuclease sbcCD subunit C [Sphingobacterium thalpophilum]
MIPLKLIVEGLYSYQQRQTIDFSELSEAGLFGIFGAVGSGKSSLLEAITYGLYGETERLNARDKRAYNMMNLKSNRSYIELDFVNFENRVFKVTREFKRNSRNFEDVKSPTVILYEQIEGQWIPLESSNVQAVIGLSYENFKRTIIIPQGQFKEFIELGAKERTDMMKEIFQLHRFDLQDKVSLLYKNNQSELDQLNGQLLGFEGITDEHVQTTRARLQEEQQAFAAAEQQNKVIQEQYQTLKSLKEDFLELERIKDIFQELSMQRTAKEDLRKHVMRYEAAHATFFHLIKSKEKLDQENQEQYQQLQAATAKWKATQTQTQELSDRLAELRAQYDLLPQRRTSELDLELILQLLVFSDEIKTLKERAEKGRSFVQEAKQEQLQWKSRIQETEAMLEQLKRSRPPVDELMAVGQWYTTQQNILQQEVELTQQYHELATSISVLREEQEALPINSEDLEADYQRTLMELETKASKLQDEKAHLLLQQRLTQFASDLADGFPCPLCGSLDHPAVAIGDDITEELNENNRLATEINALIKLKTEQKFQAGKLLFRLQALEEQSTEIQRKLQLVHNSKSDHLKQFIWPNYKSEDYAGYLAKKQQLAAIENQISNAEQLLVKQQQNLADIEEKLEKYNKKLSEFEVDEAKKQAQISQNLDNLKLLSWSDYRSREQATVKNEYEQLKASNLRLEQDYTALSNRLNAANSELAAQNSRMLALSDQLAKINDERQQLANNIQLLLQSSAFESIEEIKALLAEELPVQKIRAELEQFQIQVETTKAQISQLEKKLADQVYDDELFQRQQTAAGEALQQLKLLTEQVARSGQELLQLEAALEKKKILLQQQAKLSLRNDNLKQLFNLFKGAGFVQYVSSIYLRQLCDHANIRFHRMTRNQLSLQINDNNDFEIIDYLNEGKSRSVKTLSGGQAFQVSLSLALALAESVQSNTRASKNFFFIDEGFGTQDIASVNIVFETLLELRRENRIVGIISHVEELKERIPISLSIEKDEEHGSQIFIN